MWVGQDVPADKRSGGKLGGDVIFNSYYNDNPCDDHVVPVINVGDRDSFFKREICHKKPILYFLVSIS